MIKSAVEYVCVLLTGRRGEFRRICLNVSRTADDATAGRTRRVVRSVRRSRHWSRKRVARSNGNPKVSRPNARERRAVTTRFARDGDVLGDRTGRGRTRGWRACTRGRGVVDTRINKDLDEVLSRRWQERGGKRRPSGVRAGESGSEGIDSERDETFFRAETTTTVNPADVHEWGQ